MIESGNSIHAHNCIEKNDFSFRRTVWNRSLFLTYPTCGKKCVTAEHTQDSPEVDFESSRSPVKSVFWNNPSLHCSALFYTWQYCSNSLLRWIVEINHAKRSSQALVHIMAARASLFADHKISGLPMRAKYRHFRTICEQTFDNSPTDPHSSSLNWQSSMHGVETLHGCWVVSFANSKYFSTYFFAWPPMS